MMTEEVAEPTTVDVETDNNDAIDDEVLASSIVPSPTTTNDPTIVKPKRKWTTWCSLHDMDDDWYVVVCLLHSSWLARLYVSYVPPSLTHWIHPLDSSTTSID